MSLTSSIYDHFDLYLTFKCDLDLQSTYTDVWMALLLLEDNNCAKLFWNPCINVPVMAQTSSIYDHFDLYLTPMTLTFNLREKNNSYGICPPRGQQLCKIILISMQKCTSYGLDKLNIWPFWPLFDPCDLDLQPTWKNVSNGTSPPRGQQLCKINFEKIHA